MHKPVKLTIQVGEDNRWDTIVFDLYKRDLWQWVGLQTVGSHRMDVTIPIGSDPISYCQGLADQFGDPGNLTTKENEMDRIVITIDGPSSLVLHLHRTYGAWAGVVVDNSGKKLFNVNVPTGLDPYAYAVGMQDMWASGLSNAKGI